MGTGKVAPRRRGVKPRALVWNLSPRSRVAPPDRPETPPKPLSQAKSAARAIS